MPIPTKPLDLFVTNGWYLEGVPGLISPHFETLDGVQKSSNSVDIVDAGSNRKYKFGTQIIDFGDMTLTRTLQGNATDTALELLAEAMIQQGIKINCFAVKLHHLTEVFRIAFEGFRIVSMNYPNFDLGGEEKFLVTFACTCDNWVKI